MSMGQSLSEENQQNQFELIVVSKSEQLLTDGVPSEMSGLGNQLYEKIRESSPPSLSFDVVPLFKTLAEDVPPSAMSEKYNGHGGDRLEEDDYVLPLSAFHSVKPTEDMGASEAELEGMAEEIGRLPEVECAYVKPPAELADFNDQAPDTKAPPSVTPDFEARQIYLNTAPAGIDARYAWSFKGGRGSGINIIDCEWGWRFTHEDLQTNKGGVVVGTASSDDNHGTAVLGEYGGDQNSFGIVGICSDARASAASFRGANTASIIKDAADLLNPGDILLLEIHRRGPDGSGHGQDGYIAVEWWPDDYAAIRYAVRKGIVVVEAAGNGARNFDAPIFDRRPVGFPASWNNPFNPANPSSGAVVVGAGAPPPGTHGRDHGPDRSRLGFSNYGRRIDAQGWGREVTTTGYGDLQGGNDRDLWYTDQFSGTSSASPIIVGALGCIQGILKARGLPLLNSSQAITLLRTTGTPQQDAPGRPRTQRIGNRPNLRQMIPAALGTTPVPDFTDLSVSSPSSVTISIGDVTVTIESPQKNTNSAP